MKSIYLAGHPSTLAGHLFSGVVTEWGVQGGSQDNFYPIPGSRYRRIYQAYLKSTLAFHYPTKSLNEQRTSSILGTSKEKSSIASYLIWNVASLREFEL